MAVAESRYEEFKEPPYAPPNLRCRMVEADLLGHTTGRGFCTRGGSPRAPPLAAACRARTPRREFLNGPDRELTCSSEAPKPEGRVVLGNM